MASEKWNEQMVVYSYDGVLFSIDKEWHSNLNKLQNDYAEWKKPDTIEYVLYDFI